MSIDAKRIAGLVLTATCIVMAMFAGSAAAQNCPECDQYIFDGPNPRGTDGPTSQPTVPPAGQPGAEGPGVDPAPLQDSSSAPDRGSKKSGDGQSRSDEKGGMGGKDKRPRKDAGGADDTPDTASSPTATPSGPLIFEERGAAEAALAQFANPLTIALALAMAASFAAARRGRINS